MLSGASSPTILSGHEFWLFGASRFDCVFSLQPGRVSESDSSSAGIIDRKFNAEADRGRRGSEGCGAADLARHFCKDAISSIRICRHVQSPVSDAHHEFNAISDADVRDRGNWIIRQSIGTPIAIR